MVHQQNKVFHRLSWSSFVVVTLILTYRQAFKPTLELPNKLGDVLEKQPVIISIRWDAFLEIAWMCLLGLTSSEIIIFKSL